MSTVTRHPHHEPMRAGSPSALTFELASFAREMADRLDELQIALRWLQEGDADVDQRRPRLKLAHSFAIYIQDEAERVAAKSEARFSQMLAAAREATPPGKASE